ncbi:VOC family protein [Janibacter cremeus]|uniref:Putative pterin-4-alpha-carbinolamine dehydratase n=1 Tax=Janibacter cremeus TaxID=1285192 RepID=A0A852VQL8_9MICO|nr:VOC family protein [Janibacter cremeus]NYF98078.1 4a-hydroxytetrahydrobiopterin dehydratase [Janibacter cremeus]
MSNDAKQILTSQQVHDQAPIGWREVDGMLRTRLTTSGFEESLRLVQEIASAADEANHHPDIDLRYGWVGLAMASHDVGGITSRDIELAGTIARIADERGAQLTPEVTTSMTVGINTSDPDAIRDFWAALTGHTPAPHDSTSLPSPDGQLPEIWFQVTDDPGGRGRTHLDVYVPNDLAQERVDAVLAAGGVLVTDDFAPSWWVLADADGNQACVCTSQPHN